jgi:hypothetical protein
MLTICENCRLLYMISIELTHLNSIHYNNILAKITKAKINLMKFESKIYIHLKSFMKT